MVAAIEKTNMSPQGYSNRQMQDAYSKAVFTFVKKLDADQVSAAEEMAKEMKKIQTFVDIDDSDYDEPEEPKTDNDGFMAVPDNAINEELPFN